LTLLYRQMKPLVEGGFVYIAQPPLYKLTRGKREEYIETEEEMNTVILEMGMEGLKLTKKQGNRSFQTPQFKEILYAAVDLGRITETLKRRGVDFQEYMHSYDKKSHKLPFYMVKVDTKTHFVSNDEDLAKLTKEAEEAQYVEIFEREDLEIIENTLQKLDLSAKEFTKPEMKESYDAGDKKQKTPKKKSDEPVLKALFVVEDENDKHEFFSIQEILEFVRRQAQKGMHIQRYKGLGEMNPQQLWDTTMDPARRTILKVTVEDAVEVDKTFSMLMGDEVEPRRKFIESHAHAVKELDI